MRPIDLRGQTHLSFEAFDAKKSVTNNYLPSEVEAPLNSLYECGFAGIHISTNEDEIDLRTSKKGKVLLGRRRNNTDANPEAGPEPHNRVKNLPLSEDKPSRLLQLMGVQSADGRVKPTMRAKFTQINQFLTLLMHSVESAKLPMDRPWKLLDCGCGSSYLTLAAHHYLNDVLGQPAELLGVDVNEDLIRKSMEKVDAAGARGLNFACGRIGEIDTTADIVLALHACDTATDDAIGQAIRSKAEVVLVAPCCQHHLNRQLTATGPEVLRPLLRHGILRERTADLLTDAFRALALRIAGYRTDVVEFVSSEHTPRNVLIRGVRGGPTRDPQDVEEFEKLKQFWNVTPAIEPWLKTVHG